jgi:segregation and condensation protein A
MAALLAEIKSRMLLPRPPAALDDEEDPRLALIRQLQEYERFKDGRRAYGCDAATRARRLPRARRARRPSRAAGAGTRTRRTARGAGGVYCGARALRAHHQISAEALSVRERMARILETLEHEAFVDFVNLLTVEEGRLGVVVAFLAVLELSKAGLLEWGQGEAFGPIQVRRRAPAPIEE